MIYLLAISFGVFSIAFYSNLPSAWVFVVLALSSVLLLGFLNIKHRQAPSVVLKNSSCVLIITWQGQSILLAGDIEKKAEQTIVESGVLQGYAVSVLIAPHHGSTTSSTNAFVKVVKPEHVVFSSGFRHHFGHPHPDVVRRSNSAVVSFGQQATKEL